MKYTRYYTVDKVDVWVACPGVCLCLHVRACVCSNIMECNGVQWVGTMFILCILNKEYIYIYNCIRFHANLWSCIDATQNSNFGSL